MMEKRVLVKWDYGLLGIFFLRIKLLMFKSKNFLLKPTFHYSTTDFPETPIIQVSTYSLLIILNFPFTYYL